MATAERHQRARYAKIAVETVLGLFLVAALAVFAVAPTLGAGARISCIASSITATEGRCEAPSAPEAGAGALARITFEGSSSANPAGR